AAHRAVARSGRRATGRSRGVCREPTGRSGAARARFRRRRSRRARRGRARRRARGNRHRAAPAGHQPLAVVAAHPRRRIELMRLGIALLVALFLGALAAHFMFEDRGYVLIDYRGYLIEMSVPALAFLLVLLYLAVRGVAMLWRTPHRLGVSLAERRQRNAGRELTRGLMHIADGNWAKGERLLLRGARASDAPLIHYLMAARAAQQQGSTERRDEWLKIAHEALPEAESTVLLTQAELQLEAGEHARALDAANRVLAASPEHPIALALAARACAALDRRTE